MERVRGGGSCDAAGRAFHVRVSGVRQVRDSKLRDGDRGVSGEPSRRLLALPLPQPSQVRSPPVPLR